MTINDRVDEIDEMSVLAALGEENSNESLFRKSILTHGLKKEHFASSTNADAFERLMANPCVHQGDSLKLLLNGRSEEEIDRILVHLPKGDTIHFDRLVCDFARRRQKEALARDIQKTIKESKDPHIPPDVMASDMRRVVEEHIKSLKLKSDEFYSIADLANPRPEEEDPNCLFAGRFLEKGGALGLISVSGAGKSVLSLQLAYAWALGREALGIRPMRPLKICIFQTEDSEPEMSDFRQSIREGYRLFHGWSQQDIEAAEKNLIIASCKGKMDDEFFSFLDRGQRDYNFDLLVINPLSGVCTGNLSDNTEMATLLCRKIDPILRRGGHECGLLIVHHTNKPSNNPNGQPFGAEANAQYALSGANKITGWMRAILTLLPAKGKGQYKFIASKRGKRLKWPETDPNASLPTRIVRHSTPEEGIMFWHDLTPGDSAPTPAPTPKKPCSTPAENAEALAAELRKSPLSLTDARSLAQQKFKRKAGDEAYENVLGHLSHYSLVIQKIGSSNKKVIGTKAAVKDL